MNSCSVEDEEGDSVENISLVGSELELVELVISSDEEKLLVVVVSASAKVDGSVEESVKEVVVVADVSSREEDAAIELLDSTIDVLMSFDVEDVASSLELLSTSLVVVNGGLDILLTAEETLDTSENGLEEVCAELLMIVDEP